MEPFGDPEARIRDLERPLADQAGATELGTRPYEAIPPPTVPVPPASQYGVPPQPDPYPGQPYPQYSSPYYAAPQQVVRKRSASTALWLIPLAVVVLVAGVIGILAFVDVSGHQSASPSPGSPGISGGGGPVAVPVPTVQHPVPQTDPQLTVEPGRTLSIGGIDKHQTVVCTSGMVGISGVNNAIDIRGACGNVTVSGMNNVVTVESAQNITASGFDNKVTYRGGAPHVSTSGTGNVVEQG